MKVAKVNKHMAVFPLEEDLDRYLELIEQLIKQGVTAITFTSVDEEQGW